MSRCRISSAVFLLSASKVVGQHLQSSIPLLVTKTENQKARSSHNLLQRRAHNGHDSADEAQTVDVHVGHRANPDSKSHDTHGSDHPGGIRFVVEDPFQETDNWYDAQF